MNDSIFIYERIRKLKLRQRRRTIMACRLRNGLLSLIRQPWKLFFPVLLAIFTSLAWCNRGNVPLPGGNSGFHPLAVLWQLSISLLIIVLSLLLLWGLLIKLGTPPKAKDVDKRLEHIALVDRYGISPALISVQKVDCKAKRLVFYSRGIEKKTWEQKQGAIEDVLDCHFVAPIQYGNTRYHIVLTVAPGVERRRSEPLYDEEL